MIADQVSKLLEIYATLEPPLVAGLNAPAHSSEIWNAERELDVEFPEDLRELLLCANGQPYQTATVSLFIPGYRFADTGWRGRASYGWLLDADQIAQRTKWTREEYEQFAGSHDETFELTGPVYFHNRFIDFTASENSDNLVLDLMPAPGGSVGQVVMMSTQPCHLAVLAPSIASFLDLIIDGFSQHRFLPNCDGQCPVWWDGGW